MDWPDLKQMAGEVFRKYRYMAVILLAGLILMALPEKKGTAEAAPSVTAAENEELQEKLAQILSAIDGAGKVEVLLTEVSGAETLYQTDTDQSGSDLREDTVILSDTGSEETGLIRQVNPPKYLGALIVCQGADSPTVRLAIVEALMSVTGLKSNQITVLKMK